MYSLHQSGYPEHGMVHPEIVSKSSMGSSLQIAKYYL
jgi:metal-dependent HD superfamily phosphatase/phosphodiesterase